MKEISELLPLVVITAILAFSAVAGWRLKSGEIHWNDYLQ